MRSVALPLVLVFSLASCGGESPLVTVSSGTAVSHVNILDVESGAVRQDMTVVIEGNRIGRVAPSDSVAVGGEATEIAMPGTFMLPGLWDMHAHTYSDAEARGAFLPAFVMHGITGIRDMFADCAEVCAGEDSRDITSITDVRHPSADMVDGWMADIAAGTLVGPRLIRSSYIIGTGPSWPSASSVEGVAEARSAVVAAARRGADFIKIYPTLGRDEFLEVARVADSLGLPLAGHAPLALTPAESSDAGMDSFEHLDRLVSFCTGDRGPVLPAEDGAPPPGVVEAALETCAEVFPTLAANGTHLVPTLIVLWSYGHLRDPAGAPDPRRGLLPQDILTLWDSVAVDPRVPDQAIQAIGVQHRIAAALTVAALAAGVPVMAGSDTPNPNVYPGSGLHDELDQLVEAGLSPLDALRAATVVPVRFLGLDGELGAVSPGYLADLVVVSSDPSVDVTRMRDIQLVVAEGRVYRLEDLERMRATIGVFAASF